MRWTFQLEVLKQGKLGIEKIKTNRNANAPNLGLGLQHASFTKLLHFKYILPKKIYHLEMGITVF